MTGKELYGLDQLPCLQEVHGLKAWSPDDDTPGKWSDHDGYNLSNDQRICGFIIGPYY